MKHSQYLIAAFFLLGTMPSFACKPAKVEHEIIFEKNVETLNGNQIQELRNWYTAWLTRPFGRSQGIVDVGIFANAIAGNETSISLAEARNKNILRSIGTRDTNPVPIHASIETISPQSSYAFSVDQIILSVQPTCTVTDICCAWVSKSPS